MIKQLQTSRTCSVCGQKKPLVAFLELAGDKGHTYGDICATCRGARRGLKKAVDDLVEQTGGTSRLQIDSKAKTQMEQDKKKQAKEHSDQDYEEKVKKENTETQAASKQEQREQTEKKYREDYLELRKQRAAAKPDKAEAAAATKEQQYTQAQGFYQEKTRMTHDFHQKAGEQQFGKKTSGLTTEYINKYAAATGRSAESMFGQMLGQLMRNHLQTQKNNAGPQKTKEADKKDAAPAGKVEEQETAATEFVQNNFKKR